VLPFLLPAFVAAAAFAEPEMIPLEAVEIVGHDAPPIELKLREGGSFKLEEHRGRVVVLSFWASWCGPCRLELPALSEYAATRNDVDIIAINVDRKQPEAERFLKGVKVTLPIVWDPDALMLGEFAVMSMPTSFVIDKHGKVHARKIGFSQEKGLTELIGYIDEASRK
jgi:thiol-disulfide isomerase/thioredoxin